jgi:sporulation protein YlmC with PRC-barrel domain
VAKGIYRNFNNQDIGDLLISSEKLNGLQIITSEAEILGEVKGATIDTKSWQITELHAKLSNTAAEELNMKKRLGSTVVSIPVSVVQAVGNLVSLSKSMKDLKSSGQIIEYKE